MRAPLLLPVLVLGLAVSSRAAHAQGTPLPPGSPVVQELLAHSRSTTRLKADFTQEKHMRMLATPLISHGSIRFEQPDRLRWQVDAPDPYVAVMDGKAVRIREDGRAREAGGVDKQVFTAISALISGVLSGQLLSGPEMAPTYFKTPDGVRVEMVPTDARMAKRMGQVILEFVGKDKELRALTMVGAQGDRTVLRFTNTEYGTAHPSSAFTIP